MQTQKLERIDFMQTDNLSLKRIINEPKRGIGKTSLDKVEELSLR